jgi:hypothetical protein
MLSRVSMSFHGASVRMVDIGVVSYVDAKKS